MDIHKATKKYESWLAQHITVVRPDLDFKHEQMAASPFPFLRATYYRWAQLWPELCPDACTAPTVLAVGDLHVENFGTWRDSEGRLVWGINDFDEAYELPYTNDLVRLATSALLAAEEKRLRLPARPACEAILTGYQKGLDKCGRPFVLGEEHTWLRQIAESELRDPVHFWTKMDSCPAPKKTIPASAKQALKHLMPADNMQIRVVCRRAGLGSLGRQRFVALANWAGGRMAREAKALLPSASRWVAGEEGAADIMYQVIIDQAVRCPDPFVHLCGHWIVRRLSPHCSRVELDTLPAVRDELRLLQAMGFETANVHLGTRGARSAVLRDLKQRDDGWLYDAARAMRKVVLRDWKDWKTR